MTEPRAALSEESVPSLAAGVRMKKDLVRGCMVVLGPEKVLLPDEAAIEVLWRCDGRRPLALIVDEMSVRYSRPRPEVLVDVVAFLEGLIDDGWVRVRGPR